MRNIFESFLGTPAPKESADGAGLMAVPERGMDQGDVNFEGSNLENEIALLEDKIKRYKDGEDVDGVDEGNVSDLETKLENLKAQLEENN
ncbi:MAG: hypothetical protein NTV02_03095 [Candidatus Zambryskibacteria bacterium]|nr:hypothetical protein [Candidatus Zambryskibacteria bacterium]